MQRCSSCGRWGGRGGEPCPHCGRRLRESEPITADLVSEFVEDDGADDVRDFLAEDKVPRESGPAALASLVERQRLAREAAGRSPNGSQNASPSGSSAPEEIHEALPVATPLPFPDETPPRPLDVTIRSTLERTSLPQVGEPLVHVLVTVSAEGSPGSAAERALVEIDLRPGVAGGNAWRLRPERFRFPDGCFLGGRTFHAALGSLVPELAISFLFEARLPATRAQETEIGRVTVRVPGPDGTRSFEHFLSVPRHEGQTSLPADPEVQEARDVLVPLERLDPADQLRALRARRRLHEAERRDPALLEAIDRAVAALETHGTLEPLHGDDLVAILSDTCTVGERVADERRVSLPVA